MNTKPQGVSERFKEQFGLNVYTKFTIAYEGEGKKEEQYVNVTRRLRHFLLQEIKTAKEEQLKELWELIKETDGTKTYRSVEIINSFKKYAQALGLTL